MSTGTSRFSDVVLGLAVTAPLAVGAFGLVLALGVSPVTDWFWPPPATNLAEAAALGDAARVRALTAAGASLDARLPLRPGLLDGNAASMMTPLEAAIRRRSEDSLVPLLVELGARPDPEERRRLYCLAMELGAADAAMLLEEAFELSAAACAVTSAAAGAER